MWQKLRHGVASVSPSGWLLDWINQFSDAGFSRCHVVFDAKVTASLVYFSSFEQKLKFDPRQVFSINSQNFYWLQISRISVHEIHLTFLPLWEKFALQKIATRRLFWKTRYSHKMHNFYDDGKKAKFVNRSLIKFNRWEKTFIIKNFCRWFVIIIE